MSATDALKVLAALPELVAVTVCVPARDGGVYSPLLLIVPTVPLPPATLSTLYFTIVPPGALVENCCFCNRVRTVLRGVSVVNEPGVLVAALAVPE